MSGDYQDSPSISHTLSHSAQIHLRTSPRHTIYHLQLPSTRVTPKTSPNTRNKPSYTYPIKGPPWTLQEPLQGSHLLTPATTRSFPSSVAVSVAPFELQPAPSTLQHKLIIPKTYPKTYSDPDLTETASNVRTPEECQPAVQEPPPVDPGMGQPQQRYASMGYVQNASSPMGGFAYSPTWGTRGPPPGPVLQLDMESASNAGGRVSGQVAAIERIQGESEEPLTLRL
ncbi:hypothetical protein C8R41DRAFT_915093 [Lentinula lateritia]|uniref:Uncharacterized protein n=1 Tax=Lentinula lateritia TaxID=40482 RepID=A0ABQ8VZ20_9AGAR|nr:hypothetical protein C8R41DRAFT_915093 [Lentinula lateritia]